MESHCLLDGDPCCMRKGWKPSCLCHGIEQGKVKHVADLIWSKLSGVFSKEVLHAQHVSAFCHILGSAAPKGKRQLDCAGVATTTLAVLQHLSRQGFHELAGCRLQVSLGSALAPACHTCMILAASLSSLAGRAQFQKILTVIATHVCSRCLLESRGVLEVR